jgi:hypothetical protein
MTARAILLLILIGLSGDLARPAGAGEPPNRMTPACAARDLKVITLIEAGSEFDAITPVLARAGLTQLEARVTCLAGREREALALYDDILRDLSRALD